MTMKIAWLSAQNVLGIRDAQIDLSGGVEIHGDNGAGKSSVLGALRGLVQKGGSDLITVGEGEGSVLVRLESADGAIVDVKRKLGKGLEVKRTLGGKTERVPRPQAWIESIFGELAFDPLAFATANPKDQRAMFARAFPTTLKGLVRVPQDVETEIDWEAGGFDALQQLASICESRRKDVGRDARRKRAAADDSRPESIEVEYDEDSHSEALQNVAAARAAIGALESDNRAATAHNASIDRADDEIARLAKELELARERRAQLGDKRGFVDLSQRESELAEATEIERQHVESKRKAMEVEAWRSRDSEAGELEERYRKWSSYLRSLKTKTMAELLSQINCDIEGLEVEGDGLKIDGVPISQLNRASQVNLGLKIASALQRDKEVRFVAVDNAESLTPTNRESLAAEAEGLGMQWLFLVASDPSQIPESALKIESGTIARAEPTPSA